MYLMSMDSRYMLHSVKKVIFPRTVLSAKRSIIVVYFEAISFDSENSGIYLEIGSLQLSCPFSANCAATMTERSEQIELFSSTKLPNYSQIAMNECVNSPIGHCVYENEAW